LSVHWEFAANQHVLKTVGALEGYRHVNTKQRVSALRECRVLAKVEITNVYEHLPLLRRSLRFLSARRFLAVRWGGIDVAIVINWKGSRTHEN